MKYDKQKDEYVLSSGRRFYSNRGIIGIDPDCCADGVVPYGYDGGVIIDGRNYDRDYAPENTPWTPEERSEVADEMIRRWTVFKG